MSVTGTSAELGSVLTHLGRSTVTAQKGTRVSFVMIRHLVIQGMTHRYSIKTLKTKTLHNILHYNKKSLALQITVCAFSLLLIRLGILSEAAKNFECAVSSRKVYSEA